MANETKSEAGNSLQKVLAQGKQVERAAVAPDGTVTIPHNEAILQSVDIADVDLLLGFSDGSFVVIPNGALDAISDVPHKVVFNDNLDSLSALFKMVGISNPAKAGSLRLVSENIDAALPPSENLSTMSEEPNLELPVAPAPMAKVSAGTSLGNKGMGKGPGMGGNGSGEGDGEVPATVSALPNVQPPVYRVGHKSEVSIQDLLNGLGLGEQPNFTQTLYTTNEFKLTPSGRADLPLGSYDANLTSAQLAQRSSPEGQSTREVIRGTSGDDSINHNTAFSSGVGQWAKTMHLTFNNFSEISDIQIVINAAKLAQIPGFNIIGDGVTRSAANSNTWNISSTSELFGYGKDIQIVYNISDSNSAPVDFGADITVTGKVGPLDFEVTNNITLSWRDATTESDFTVPGLSGDLMMILPRDGMGAEILAGDGNDTVYAGAGHDLVHGENGNDILDGGRGNDVIDGGAGADAIFGGLGNDTATYYQAAAGVTATLDANIGVVNTGEAAGDTYDSIENLTGTEFNDILIGNASANILTGGAGDDKLVGRGDNDILDGGTGIDTASYEYATTDVTVSLTTYSDTGALQTGIGAGTQGEADGDVLLSIENLIGGSGNDTFTGAAGDQANAFDGRGGIDTVSYAPSINGIVAALDQTLLLSPLTQTNDAAGDTFVNIENLTGTTYDDVLIGNNVANTLTGDAGFDILEGLGGADTFIGGADTDTVSYSNSLLGVVSSLTITFGSGPAVTQTNDALGDTYFSIENMIGSGGNDTLIGSNLDNRIEGGAGDDVLEGMGGADTLIGGVGSDTASYVHASYVKASLTTGLAGFNNEGDAAGDTYNSIENILGSDYDDILIGNSSTNILTGGDGDDVLEGLGGADQLFGGNGINTASYEHASLGVTADLTNPVLNNTDDALGDGYTNIQNLLGSAFNDTLTGDANNNSITGGAGDDTLFGMAGTDTLYGGEGDDILTDDGLGVALLDGGAGNDTIILTGRDGFWDSYIGGSGTDTLVWSGNAGSRMDVNLENGGNLGYVEGTITSRSSGTGFENVTATGTNQIYVYMSNADNVITGGSTLNDWVDFRYALGGVYANLQTGVVTGGSGNDTLIAIDNLYAGSQWDDVLIGSSTDNWIRGYYGNDYIDGGAGNDTWYIDWSGNAVTASLLTATQNAAMGIIMTGDAAGDTVTNMESIYSSYGDFLYGDSAANNLYGRGLIEGFIGADIIRGTGVLATASYANAGNSYLAGQGITTATDTGVVATLTTAFSVGPAVINSGDATGDTYSGINHLTGSAFADTLIGNSNANTLTGGASDDILEGLSGADIFLGGSGNDTISFAHSTAGVVVDLQNRGTGIYTATNDAVGDSYNSIENFIGSNYNDTVYGTSSDNTLIGGLGNDILDGDAGFDTASYATAAGAVTINLATNTVTGAAGNDTLVSIERVIGSAFNDNITGSAGNDIIDGGAGADNIDGGAGSDTVSYASATSAKSVNLETGANTDNDIFTSIENIIGSNSTSGDILSGNSGDNVIEGGLGDDILDGGAHGAGGDTASYAGATAAVSVSLASGTASGAAGNDTLINFENLLGSDYNDTLTGDGNANILNGGAGNDILVGGAGADTLIGGQGIDTVSYAAAAAGVTVTINGSGSAGEANGDLLSGIENLIGSAFNDILTGDGGANLISGGAGDDIMNGQEGIDTVSYANTTGSVTVSLASIAAQNTGGAGIDTLSNFENILGSAFADTLTGDGSANIIEGGAGADILTGGLGSDTASYSESTSGVHVSLVAAATNSGGDAAGDTLSGFENLLGSEHNDTLIGDLNANTLDGGAGDDTLIGGAGADMLIGGTGNNTASYSNAGSAVNASLSTGTGTLGDANGDLFSGIQNLTGSNHNDTLTGDANANILIGGLGNDRLDGNAGNDTIDIMLGRDTTYGGDGDDTFYVDALGTIANGNLPTLVDGQGNTTWSSGGGDTIKLFNLATTYSLTSLAGVTNNMEFLDIRDGSSTSLALTSLDIRNFVDGGNNSQIWVKANSGDSINLSGLSAVGDTYTQTSGAAGTTDYTIYNSSSVQVAQIHWQTS